MASVVPLAVITGGTSGIGLACARRLAQDGFDLLITGRDMVRGESARHQLATAFPQRQVRFVAMDHGQAADSDKLRLAVGAQSVQALVISAAMGLQAHVLETPPTAFRDMLNVNVAGPLTVVQTLAPRLTAHASVVLISSDAGVEGEQALGAYSVTKAALNMLGKMLALDLAEQQVRVNVVCPGDTVPGMRHLLKPGQTSRAPDDYLAWPVPPRGRWGMPEDTAELVAFLTSPRSDFMVGTVTLVDGGSRAGRPDR